MNYQSLFYWLVVADNAKTLFVVFMSIFTAISVIASIVFVVSGFEDKEAPISARWMKWAIPFAALFWSLYVFTPSKKDALLIVAGGQTLNFLSSDSSAKKIPTELSNFLLTQIRAYAADANVELLGINARAKLKEEAKKLSGEELLKRIQTDTTFAKAVLE